MWIYSGAIVQSMSIVLSIIKLFIIIEINFTLAILEENLIFLKGYGKYYILLDDTGEEEGKIYSEEINM